MCSNLVPEANYPDGPFVADAYIVYRPPSTATYSNGKFAVDGGELLMGDLLL